VMHMTGATQDEVWPLVRDFHYSRRMPSAVKHCFAWREDGGLFGDYGEPVAAAIFGQPVNRNWPHDALELQRLVRRDDCDLPLSKFVAWCLRWLRANGDAPFCLSYADTGEGHHGGIYQATGWRFVGAKDSGHIGYVAEDGSFVHRRSCNAMFGASGVDAVAARKPNWIPKYGEPKNLYIFPLRQRLKPLLRRFGWQELPYPKNTAARPEDEQASSLCEAGVTPAGRSKKPEEA